MGNFELKIQKGLERMDLEQKRTQSKGLKFAILGIELPTGNISRGWIFWNGLFYPAKSGLSRPASFLWNTDCSVNPVNL